MGGEQLYLVDRVGGGCPDCVSIILKDGTSCDSITEAYFYLKFDKKYGHGNFLHNKKYGGLGNKRYDFYIPNENRYIEVTGFNNRSRNYFSYLRNIVSKKKYVEEQLNANFEFIYRRLSYRDRKFVESNILPK